MVNSEDDFEDTQDNEQTTETVYCDRCGYRLYSLEDSIYDHLTDEIYCLECGELVNDCDTTES